jgi:hypothetical protein
MAFNSALFTTFNNGITLLPSLINVSTINSTTINIAPSGINNFSFNPLLNLSTIGQYIDTPIINASSNASSINASSNASSINASINNDVITEINPVYDINIETSTPGNNNIFIPYTTNQIGYRYTLYKSNDGVTFDLSINEQTLHTITIPPGVWIVEFAAIVTITTAILTNTHIILSLSNTTTVDNTKSVSNIVYNNGQNNYNLNLTTVITSLKNTEYNIVGIDKLNKGIPKIKDINIFITRIA